MRVSSILPRPWPLLALLLLLLLGVACGREEATPTPLPTAEPTPTAGALATAVPTLPPTPTPRPTATPSPTPLPPSIMANPQTVGEAGQLVVAEVSLPSAGWLAVYPATAETLTAESLLAAVLLSPGLQPNISLILDVARATSTLQLVLHSADGEEPLDPATAEILFQTTLAITFDIVQPTLSAADQEVLEDGLVQVGPLTTNSAGWVAIHNPDGTMLGYMPVPEGETDNVTIPIRWREALPELTIALYEDYGQLGSFEREIDTPVLFQGQPITHALRVQLPLDIVVFDQPVVNRQLHVERVVSDGPAWVVVYLQEENGQPGLIIGSAAVQDGLNENIVVALTAVTPTDILILQLHDDVELGDAFNFPASDPARRYLERAFIVPVNTAVTPYLTMRDQPLGAEDSVVVPWLVVDVPAWVVVVAAVDGEPSGEILGRTPLPVGVSRQVAITLTDVPDPPAQLFAVLYRDEGTVQMFEPAVDVPLLRRSRPLAVPFTLLEPDAE
jgi:hypothetical protein